MTTATVICFLTLQYPIYFPSLLLLSTGGRTERLVNPIAWERGMVIVQCEHCKAWHKVADAANLVEEIRYADLENSDAE